MKSNLSRTIGVLAALSAAFSAYAQGKISAIAAHTVGDGTVIEIKGEGLSRPRVTRAYSNHSIILDFNAPLVGYADYVKLNQGGVKFFNFARHTSKTTRLHIRLTDTEKPTVEATPEGWEVKIHVNSDRHTAKDTNFVPKGYAKDYVMPPLEPASSVTTYTKVTMHLTPGAAALYKTATLEPTATATATTAPQAVVTAPVGTANSVSVNPTTEPNVAGIKSTTPGYLASMAFNTAAVEPTTEPLPNIATVNAAPSTVSTEVVAGAIVDGTPVPANVRARGKKKAVAHKAPTSQPVVAAPSAQPTVNVTAFEKRVTLDFANTDVVQVLKALALQAGVNIVTSPDVTGKVTVSLDNVTVKDALDLVTTMAGVRYAKVGNTFIVTTPAHFADALKQISGKADDTQETRVVPIYSGMGGQIKAAVAKAIPTEGADNYMMILPSEDLSLNSNSAAASAPAAPAAPGSAAPAAASAGADADKAKATEKSGKDTYVVLVGPKSKLDEVEPAVKSLDEQLCKSLLINVPDEMVASNQVYKTNVNSAKSLLQAIAEPDKVADLKTQPNRTTVGHVQLYASNAGQGDQLIILNGPKNEVDNLMGVLAQLDDPGLTKSKVQVYEVKFADPRALQDELLVQIPGLRVTVPTASAGNQSLYVPNGQRAEAATQGAGATSAPVQGNTQAAPAGATTSSSTSSNGSLGTGLSLPFVKLESGAVPMRLILKGTDAQIDQALSYLHIVDVAPKQVALEMRVMELSKDDAINAGISWDLVTGGAVKFLKLDNNSTSTSSNNTGSVHTGGHNWGMDVAGQLDRIANSSNLIARPNLLAIDGRESEIFIGDVIRYVSSVVSSTSGPSLTTDSVSVGVRLSVLPRVGEGGSLTMELRPVVSFLTGFNSGTQGSGSGAVTYSLPQTSERVAQSTVLIKSGETIAIGGLIQDQDRKNAKGVPFLMNLPIVGSLFKSTNNEHIRTELVIFLTAREVDGPADASTKLPQQTPEVKPGK